MNWNSLLNNCVVLHAVQIFLDVPFNAAGIGFHQLRHTKHPIYLRNSEPVKYLDIFSRNTSDGSCRISLHPASKPENACP